MALYFDNVNIYSMAMGLFPAEQADVNTLYHREGAQTATIKCLQIWKEHNPSRATYRGLLDIVLGLGKGDTADHICRQMTQRKLIHIYVSVYPPFLSRKQLHEYNYLIAYNYPKVD